MPFGNEMFLLGRSPARTELREVAVEALLHLVVENDPEISASLPLDLLRGLLIEPEEIGIVVGFSGLGESVVENLTFAGALSLGEETMAVLGEGEQLARTHFLMGDGLYFDQALVHEIFDIRPNAPFVPAVGELRQVLLSNRTKHAGFDHRCDFRCPQTIGPAPDFVDLAQLRGASHAGGWAELAWQPREPHECKIAGDRVPNVASKLR